MEFLLRLAVVEAAAAMLWLIGWIAFGQLLWRAKGFPRQSSTVLESVRFTLRDGFKTAFVEGWRGFIGLLAVEFAGVLVTSITNVGGLVGLMLLAAGGLVVFLVGFVAYAIVIGI